MLYDATTPSCTPDDFWEWMGGNSPQGNFISDIAATNDHKLLFATFKKGWWAILDLTLDKCVYRQNCVVSDQQALSCPTSIAISTDDKFFYMVTGSGIVENYDIQAAVTKQMKSIPGQSFTKIAVDPYNQFIFIASYSGNLYKFDSG
jgi:hypothetical protein